MIFMRKPGRVLFSLRVIRSIAAPSTLSAIARAKHRHAIRGAITSAIDDMQYIHGNADDKTKEHLLVEIERLFTVMYMEPGKTIRLGPIQGADGPQDNAGEPEPNAGTQASKAALDFEASLL